MPEKDNFFKQFMKLELIPKIIESTKSVIETGVKNIQDQIHRTVNFAIKKMMAFFLVIIGGIFLLVGVANLLENSIVLPKGSGFILIGVIIAIIGLIVGSLAKR